jgi:hypothetical protein
MGDVLYIYTFLLKCKYKHSPSRPVPFYMNGRELVVGNKCGKMGISDGLDIFKSFGFKELIEFMES